MWQTKTFKTLGSMRAWIARREGEMQYEEIAVNNAYEVTWRWLRVM